jgi:hypothetical protein
VGHSYSTLAWIPEEKGSWALPLRHEHISSFETPGRRAAFQLKQVTRQLGVRPLAIYDRGYGNARFMQLTAAIEADLLVRLSANRCVFAAPHPTAVAVRHANTGASLSAMTRPLGPKRTRRSPSTTPTMAKCACSFGATSTSSHPHRESWKLSVWN